MWLFYIWNPFLFAGSWMNLFRRCQHWKRGKISGTCRWVTFNNSFITLVFNDGKQHTLCISWWYHCSAWLGLTQLLLVQHICVSESGRHWFRKWLVTYSVPSHYLKQCWVIVNWTFRNNRQWNVNQNTKLFIHENASENIVCEMAAFLSKGRWVNLI